MARFVGLDLGAGTVKVAELTGEEGAPRWTGGQLPAPDKDPAGALLHYSMISR